MISRQNMDEDEDQAENGDSSDAHQHAEIFRNNLEDITAIHSGYVKVKSQLPSKSINSWSVFVSDLRMFQHSFVSRISKRAIISSRPEPTFCRTVGRNGKKILSTNRPTWCETKDGEKIDKLATTVELTRDIINNICPFPQSAFSNDWKIKISHVLWW